MLDIKIILGINVKALRESLHLSQEDFGEIIDIGPTAISTIETGKSFTTSETLDKICTAFKIPPHALFELDSHYIKTDYTDRKESVNDINILLNNLDGSKIRLVTEFLQVLSDKNLDFKYRNL